MLKFWIVTVTKERTDATFVLNMKVHTDKADAQLAFDDYRPESGEAVEVVECISNKSIARKAFTV